MRGNDGSVYYLRPLRREDVDQVVSIEREAFSPIGSPAMFKRELENRTVRYLVAVQESQTEPLISTPLSTHPSPPNPFGWLKQIARTILFPGKVPMETTNDLLVGFVGIWFMPNEAHITAIAVRYSHRGQGIGEFLLIGAIEMAILRRARVVSLETRVSNEVAQGLYEKYGFNTVGVRKGYYTDNHEDALVMVTDQITTASYQERFQRLFAQFRERRGEPLWTLA